jgi:ribosomal protein S12 methylthiotransferase
LATPRHTAYIKINEGCDHPCTFCVIPQLRGKFRSRRFESVVREAENLAVAGVREISLIGQDTTYYGEDLGLRDGLPLLLERLAQIEDLSWVRFLYCYPNRITPKLLETIAAHPRLAKYLDIPLQHASRSVLARMKRGSNADAFLKMLARIRATIPGVSIRTSFIVGFLAKRKTISASCAISFAPRNSTGWEFSLIRMRTLRRVFRSRAKLIQRRSSAAATS